MEHIDELIARAVRVLGSEQALATKIEVPVTSVREWASRQTRCAPDDVAVIAAAAGFDAVAWFIRASLARHGESPRGHLLYEALFRVVASDHRGAQFLWSAHRHRSW